MIFALLSLPEIAKLVLGFLFVFGCLFDIAHFEKKGPERQRAERAEPIDFKAALRVRDRSRRGPVAAEDFQGKRKLGRVA